jgi:hypothetical protein
VATLGPAGSLDAFGFDCNEPMWPVMNAKDGYGQAARVIVCEYTQKRVAYG